MTRRQVVEILGEPRINFLGRGRPRKTDPYWSYGYLQMPMVPHEYTYRFSILFDECDRVRLKIDPFNGKFSADGKPTVPEIITPLENSIFSHFPRILDLRWTPSSGVYPIAYTVEIGEGSVMGNEPFHDMILEQNLGCPFYIATIRGAQPGRFRVQARNELGESDWSEFRNFTFLK